MLVGRLELGCVIGLINFSLSVSGRYTNRYWIYVFTSLHRNLPNTCGPALEVIVTLTCDEYSLVSNAANKTLVSH